MRLAICLILALLALTACQTLTGTQEPSAPPGTPEFLEQQSDICEANGGRFGDAPGGKAKLCFITPADANQPCSQASDCEGHCLARSRTCAPVKPLLGCNEVLMDGGLPATVCLN